MTTMTSEVPRTRKKKNEGTTISDTPCRSVRVFWNDIGKS
jgi:hypothetical protein